ncbi:MAG: oxidoreductase [Bacteroidota bacterium]
MSVQITKGNKTALLFGASGLVGGHCLDFLLASPSYSKIHSFGRRTLPVENAKLVQHKIDFEDLLKNEHLIKGDDLFCCIGTTMAKAGSKEAFQKVDYTYIYEIAKIGAANGVNQFLLVSSVGADPNSLFFYSRVKGKTEMAVSKQDYWAIHIFRPSVLLGERNENRWGESVAGKLGSLFDAISGGLLSKYSPIEADVVAKAMVNAAQKLDGGIHLYPSNELQELAKEEDQKRKRLQ